MYKILLPAGWGSAKLKVDHCGASFCSHSYDAMGSQLCWDDSPGELTACDLEHENTDLIWLKNHFSLDSISLLSAWVLTETIAKLENIPIFYYLKKYGLIKPRVIDDTDSVRSPTGKRYNYFHHYSPDTGHYMAFGKGAAA